MRRTAAPIVWSFGEAHGHVATVMALVQPDVLDYACVTGGHGGHRLAPISNTPFLGGRWRSNRARDSFPTNPRSSTIYAGSEPPETAKSTRNLSNRYQAGGAIVVSPGTSTRQQ
jgi:hypothetical protein